MANLFWTDRHLEPKRNYRFVIDIPGMGPGSARFYAKKVGKPQIDVSEQEHKYLNHSFYYPGRVTWSDITAVFVDPVNPDASQNLSAIIEASGYVIPRGPNDLTTMSKAAAVTSLGDVIIEQYDDVRNGAAAGLIERWVLKNAWIKSVKFSELDYDNEDLSTAEVTFRYDWAELTTRTPNSASPADQGLSELGRNSLQDRWKLE